MGLIARSGTIRNNLRILCNNSHVLLLFISIQGRSKTFDREGQRGDNRKFFNFEKNLRKYDKKKIS